MPHSSSNFHFLGIELATDQLRASVVDDQLDLVGVESVDFDSELPEFQTQGGIFTTPGDAYTTPVDMWVKALDLLLEKLRQNFDLSKIKSIGGAAQHACVWWRTSAVSPANPFTRLNPHQPLHTQLGSAQNSFSIPHTPVAQDTSTLAQAQALEGALGGPDRLAGRVGTPAHASLTAAQILKVRETHADAWARTGRLTLASAFLASVLLGAWAPLAEGEACATGMWAHANRAWDDLVLEIVAGTMEDAGRLKMMLGDVDVSGGGKKIGNIAPYFVERYGFSPETFLIPFTSDCLSTYLSLCPSPTDSVLAFGPMDIMLTAAPHYLPTRLYTLVPHPAQESSEKRKYIAMLMSRNGDVPRTLVRDMYTKSWSAFDRLIAIVPPGGSIGLDDKLFSFWLLQGEAFPFSHVKGIFRFETGIKVNEFRDLRANPRCLLESQLLSFRVRYARMRCSNLFFPSNRGTVINALSPSSPASMGLTFDPYATNPLPRRILATGAAANFSSVVNLLGDVFNAPVFVPTTQLDSAQVAPHRNAPAPGFCSRASLGGAYVARWVWGRERDGTHIAFEDEVRRLLAKRWVASGAQAAAARDRSSAKSASPAPYLHSRTSGLGNTVLVEEDEEEGEEFMDPYRSANGNGHGMGGEHLRTTTSSSGMSMATSSSGFQAPSTAFTSPDISMLSGNGFMGNGGGSGSGHGTPTTAVPPGITPLTPVAALPTGDAEAQLGLAKVAEPDADAFMTYASIVPEFCRLEAMLVKALV